MDAQYLQPVNLTPHSSCVSSVSMSEGVTAGLSYEECDHAVRVAASLLLFKYYTGGQDDVQMIAINPLRKGHCCCCCCCSCYCCCCCDTFKILFLSFIPINGSSSLLHGPLNSFKRVRKVLIPFLRFTAACPQGKKKIVQAILQCVLVTCVSH